ncbi:protein of unknown function [Desulfitobacterium chlororespirans DSM 11544]|uniref:DUF4418 domain-containing protein n=2 Tax=Desulfitobacterium chlororespirans TaxID=51616 RepID=A0A1M7UKB9_9FIRM|nr:protein of unknown function [Desulfitobacterium chlororespirans DSM 11544]
MLLEQHKVLWLFYLASQLISVKGEKGGKMSMKRTSRLALGIFILILGILIALGPQYIFKICEQHHGTTTACFWTARALIGVGGVIALLGAAVIFLKSTPLLAGLSLAVLLNSILAFLIPNLLIGVCGEATMDCRVVTLPALNILTILSIIISAGSTGFLFVKYRKESVPDAHVSSELD